MAKQRAVGRLKPTGATSSGTPGLDLQIITATSSAHWEKWLAGYHGKSAGVWLRIYKKDSGIKTVSYAEALDGALCHGWIDGLRKAYDAESFIQRFTPRRPRSVWSKINTQHVGRLTKSGRMKNAGLEAVAAAKRDGRWAAAYDSGRTAAVPRDFLKELERNVVARAFFQTLNRTNVYAIIWRLQTARKPETRARRMKAICEMLAKREKFHP
jgi:uncharacterized protein YdeI (YjbR/CyaY-like superfamily)